MQPDSRHWGSHLVSMVSAPNPTKGVSIQVETLPLRRSLGAPLGRASAGQAPGSPLPVVPHTTPRLPELFRRPLFQHKRAVPTRSGGRGVKDQHFLCVPVSPQRRGPHAMRDISPALWLALLKGQLIGFLFFINQRHTTASQASGLGTRPHEMPSSHRAQTATPMGHRGFIPDGLSAQKARGPRCQVGRPGPGREDGEQAESNLSRFPWKQSLGALGTEARASASPVRHDRSPGARPLGLRGRQGQRRDRQSHDPTRARFHQQSCKQSATPAHRPPPGPEDPQHLAEPFLFLPHLGGGGCENDPPPLSRAGP